VDGRIICWHSFFSTSCVEVWWFDWFQRRSKHRKTWGFHSSITSRSCWNGWEFIQPLMKNHLKDTWCVYARFISACRTRCHHVYFCNFRCRNIRQWFCSKWLFCTLFCCKSRKFNLLVFNFVQWIICIVGGCCIDITHLYFTHLRSHRFSGHFPAVRGFRDVQTWLWQYDKQAVLKRYVVTYSRGWIPFLSSIQQWLSLSLTIRILVSSIRILLFIGTNPEQCRLSYEYFLFLVYKMSGLIRSLTGFVYALVWASE